MLLGYMIIMGLSEKLLQNNHNLRSEELMETTE